MRAFGKTHTFHLPKNTKISTIKKSIQEKESISWANQRISYCGRQLDDDETLVSSGVKKETTLQVDLRLRGAKPVILLYPNRDIDFTVQLELPSWTKLSSEWPTHTALIPTEEHDSMGYMWSGQAKTDGSLIIRDLTVPYIFYEFDVLEDHRESILIHSFTPSSHYDDEFTVDGSVYIQSQEPIFQASSKQSIYTENY